MSNRRKRHGRRRRSNPNRRKIQQIQPAISIIDVEDHISSMPDDILHLILSFVPTDLAMKTSGLSRRWRHVWREAPSLDIHEHSPGFKEIDPTLASYSAPKIKSFNLCTSPNSPQIDRWIEFAISRGVQKLSLTVIDHKYRETCDFPDVLYRNSSVEQLSVRLGSFGMVPRCTVSWVSLKDLSLSDCEVPDESMRNLISGCPILESLKLDTCGLPERLDLSLSQSPRLRRLDLDRRWKSSGPLEIVAPQIHYLRLLNSCRKTTTLVDVPSMTEANLNIWAGPISFADADIVKTKVLENLAKLHNVEKLTVGATFLQFLSLAELRGSVSFPTLKVQTLIVSTEFCQSVIPGIARLLQSSPGLKNLTVRTMMNYPFEMHCYVDGYSDVQGLSRNQCWRSKYEVFPTLKEINSMSGSCNDERSKLLASSVELLLSYAKTLETIVIRLGGIYFDNARWLEEQHQMARTLSHDNNVSVFLKRSNF